MLFYLTFQVNSLMQMNSEEEQEEEKEKEDSKAFFILNEIILVLKDVRTSFTM